MKLKKLMIIIFALVFALAFCKSTYAIENYKYYKIDNVWYYVSDNYRLYAYSNNYMFEYDTSDFLRNGVTIKGYQLRYSDNQDYKDLARSANVKTTLYTYEFDGLTAYSASQIDINPAQCKNAKSSVDEKKTAAQAANHTHYFASSWSFNSGEHWKQCLNSNCPLLIEEMKNYGEHQIENGVCKICGYKTTSGNSTSTTGGSNTSTSGNSASTTSTSQPTPTVTVTNSSNGGTETYTYVPTTGQYVDSQNQTHTVAEVQALEQNQETTKTESTSSSSSSSSGYSNNSNSSSSGYSFTSAGNSTKINPDDYNFDPNLSTDGEIVHIAKNVVSVINVIGVMVLIIAIIVVGIKYMIGSAEQRAEYKKTMVPILIGAFLLFTITTVINVVYSLVSEVESGGSGSSTSVNVYDGLGAGGKKAAEWLSEGHSQDEINKAIEDAKNNRDYAARSMDANGREYWDGYLSTLQKYQ